MIAAWLFLYVAGLVHLLAIYGLAFGDSETVAVLLPFILVPFPGLLKTHRPDLFAKVPERAVAAVGLLCALLLLRGLNLEYWPSRYLYVTWLVALIGVSSFWITLARPRLEDCPALWLRIGLWQLTGLLEPGLPLAGVSVFAFLAAWNVLPPAQPTPCPARPAKAFPAAMLLGVVLSKPWWDYTANPGWAPVLAAWGLGAALSNLPLLRRAGARLASGLLYFALAGLFVAYKPELGWFWGLCLGMIWGWLWHRLRRPLQSITLTYALLLGFCLSFALHSNLQVPLLRHILWLGN